MKKLGKIFLFLFIAFVLTVTAHLVYLSRQAPKETYPEDSYLSGVQEKNGLIVVAHDDDMAGSAGLMTRLCREGWQIREMCFYQLGGLYFKKDSARNPLRKQALQQVAAIQGLQGVDPVDFNLRRDMETEKSYMPMPYEEFPKVYKQDSLLGYISAYIEKHRPTVIFTLDDKMGGYGHPDHTLVSQLITRYCREHKNDSNFSVKKVYQAVFPPSLAENVLAKMPVYNAAREVYNVNGMPLPDVQVSFGEFAREKKACMKAYTTEQNSFRQIWPWYNWYPYWVYFRIFDREFYHIVNVADL